MAASTMPMPMGYNTNQVAGGAEPALISAEPRFRDTKINTGKTQTFDDLFLFLFLSCSCGPEQAADILSLSMPADAAYPLEFGRQIQELPPQTLAAIVKTPKKAHQLFVDGVRKLNQKKFHKLVNAGKAHTILNKNFQSAADAAVAAVIEEGVMHERRVWLNEQLQQLIQRRLKQGVQSQN